MSNQQLQWQRLSKEQGSGGGNGDTSSFEGVIALPPYGSLGFQPLEPVFGFQTNYVVFKISLLKCT